jgi:hypothetical protein
MSRMPTQAAWPPEDRQTSPLHDDYAGAQVPPAHAIPDQEPAYAVIGEMAGLLRDTRYGLLTCGGLLGAVMIGFALEAGPSARVLRPSVVGALDLAALCGLFASWLTAIGVLAWASRPVLSTLTELRWVTGAPLDTRPRWLTVPPPGTEASGWTWTRAHLLLGAARLARYRMRVADTWTYFTVGCFLAWTAIVILGP